MRVVEKALFLSGIALFVVFIAAVVTFLKQMGVS